MARRHDYAKNAVMLSAVTVIWLGLFGIAALYTVLSPRYNIGLYRNLIFHPFPFEPGMDLPPVMSDASVEELWLSLPNRKKIHGWYYRVPNAKKVILFSHGNAGNLSSRISILELLLQTECSILIYDYEGFGKSEGLPSIDGICENGLVAFDYLVEKEGIKPKDIVLYGESLGTGVAMYIADIRPAGGVILQSGFSSLRTIAQEVFPFVRVFPPILFPAQQLDTLKLARKPHPPLLIVHGKLDRVVPYHHAQIIFREAAEPKQILTLPNTGHVDISVTAPNEFVNTVKEFIARL